MADNDKAIASYMSELGHERQIAAGRMGLLMRIAALLGFAGTQSDRETALEKWCGDREREKRDNTNLSGYGPRRGTVYARNSGSAGDQR